MREFCFNCYKITKVKVKRPKIKLANKKFKVFLVYCKECYKEVYINKYERKNDKILKGGRK